MEYHRECYVPLNWGQKVLRPKMALASPSNGCNDLYPLEFVTDFRRVEDKSGQGIFGHKRLFRCEASFKAAYLR